MTSQSPVFEQWRPCPGFGRYEVSNLGNLRNVVSGRATPVYVNPNTGRRSTNLYIAPGEKRTVRVSPLVAVAFLGPRPPGLQIDHTDGDKLNDAATNLRYVSQSENIERSYRVQHLHPNRPSKRYTLTAEQYEQVFELSRQGLNQCEVARRIGCDNSTVSKILSGKIKFRPRAAPKVRLAPIHVRRGRERLEQARILLAENPGLSSREVAVRLGVCRSSVTKYRATLARAAAARGEAAREASAESAESGK